LRAHHSLPPFLLRFPRDFPQCSPLYFFLCHFWFSVLSRVAVNTPLFFRGRLLLGCPLLSMSLYPFPWVDHGFFSRPPPLQNGFFIPFLTTGCPRFEIPFFHSTYARFCLAASILLPPALLFIFVTHHIDFDEN